jgi:hypothetical protein
MLFCITAECHASLMLGRCLTTHGGGPECVTECFGRFMAIGH